ncbi:hypothetical protein ACIQVO_36525 [Streptomyces sp. NPDC101062]|uniref:hypothetical protein n=1 Tax=unclassified Streptomyces TaxID=2593676 RepID=UPI00380069B3
MTALAPAATGLTALLVHRQRPRPWRLPARRLPHLDRRNRHPVHLTRHGADFLKAGVPHQRLSPGCGAVMVHPTPIDASGMSKDQWIRAREGLRDTWARIGFSRTPTPRT